MISSDKYLNTPPEIAKDLRRFFGKDDELVILDIGACEGLDSIKYSNMFPRARVLAFEPVPANVKKIQANLKKYDRPGIVVVQEALSDAQGTATFFVSSGHPDNQPKTTDWDFGNKSSSLLAPQAASEVHPWLEFNEKIEVPTNTLKNACKQHQIKSIDLIHMDVQGAELMVLKGAEELMQQIKLIWLEVEAIELYKNQPVKSDVENFMSDRGFQILKDTVGSVSGDQLYINSEFYQSSMDKIGLRGKIRRLFG